MNQWCLLAGISTLVMACGGKTADDQPVFAHAGGSGVATSSSLPFFGFGGTLTLSGGATYVGSTAPATSEPATGGAAAFGGAAATGGVTTTGSEPGTAGNLASGGAPATGGAPLTGGAATSEIAPSTGGVAAIGGNSATAGASSAPGGASNSGGVAPTGGTANSGGVSSSKTASYPTVDARNCGVASDSIGNFSVTDGYYKTAAFAGYGYVYISPGPDDTLTYKCDRSSFGPSTSALCGAGTVPADPSRNACAGIGFHLNQDPKGHAPQPIAAPAQVTTVNVTVTVTLGMSFQIKIAQSPLDKTAKPKNYCYLALPWDSPLSIAASDFTTTCWSYAEPGDSWDGTRATSLEVIVPSECCEERPFDICIQDVSFEGT